MTTNQGETIGDNGLAVTVRMGEGFEPESRTSAALAELLDAIHEDYGGEVAGFEFDRAHKVRGFSFTVTPSAPGDGTTEHFFTIEFG